MKKVIGYACAGVGFGLILLGMNFINYNISFLGELPKYFLTIIGIIFIIFSLLFLKENSLNSKSTNRKSNEKHPIDLPIYQGDSIVGYRRDLDIKGNSKNKRGKR